MDHLQRKRPTKNEDESSDLDLDLNDNSLFGTTTSTDEAESEDEELSNTVSEGRKRLDERQKPSHWNSKSDSPTTKRPTSQTVLKNHMSFFNNKMKQDMDTFFG